MELKNFIILQAKWLDLTYLSSAQKICHSDSNWLKSFNIVFFQLGKGKIFQHIKWGGEQTSPTGLHNHQILAGIYSLTF
jgi:hypothetical protein